MNRDLTAGDPEKVLWRFCIPLFASVIFQQLYNIADSLVAGKFIGENALAAVGNSYEITLIFIAIAFGCNMGCSVIVSRYFGAKDFKNVRRAVSTAMISSGVICTLLLLIGVVFSSQMLTLINTPPQIFEDSEVYLLIYVWGLPFMFFYNIATGIFSAMGDSKTPFYFLAASSTANIVVDIIFVTCFDMGVSGVAWATFLCQGISCILAMIFVIRRLMKMNSGTVNVEMVNAEKLNNDEATEETLTTETVSNEEKLIAETDDDGEGKLFSWKIFKQITIIAVPSMLQQSFISFGNIIIQGLINGFGPGVVAGYAAAVKLNSLVITPFTTLGNGVSNFTSQNLGAGKPERIVDGFKAGIKMVWILCVPMVLLYFFGGRLLLSFFLDEPTQDAVSTGIIFLRILSPFYFVVSAKLISDGVLRGSGMMAKFMTGTFTDLIIRVVLAAIMCRTVLGSVGIWSAWPLGWIISTLVSLYFFQMQYVQKKK